MKKQISRFSIHQTSKVAALIYFVILAIFVIPAGLYYAFYMSDMANAAIMFIAPFIGLVFNYILTAIILSIYNGIAKAVGGIEFTLTDNTSLNG